MPDIPVANTSETFCNIFSHVGFLMISNVYMKQILVSVVIDSQRKYFQSQMQGAHTLQFHCVLEYRETLVYGRTRDQGLCPGYVSPLKSSVVLHTSPHLPCSIKEQFVVSGVTCRHIIAVLWDKE